MNKKDKNKTEYEVLRTRNVDLHDMAITRFEDNFENDKLPIEEKIVMLKQLKETLDSEYDG